MLPNFVISSWLSVRYSLRFRLLLTLLLFMMGLYYWIQNNVSSVLSDVAIEHTKSSIRLTSEALNLAITPHTTMAGLKGLSDYFHELLTYDGSGLVYLALYDDSGVMLVGAGTELMDQRAIEAPLLTQIQQGVVHVVQPILILHNQIGELRYGLSTRAFDDSIRRIHDDNLWVMFIAILLVSLVLLFSIAQLNKRFSRLLTASKALASGDYSVRAPQTSQDELSLLATHFNVIAAAVQSRIQALEASQASIHQLNAKLEQRVSDRTSELVATLETLKETQQHLIQSEKLASLGALVAGVSHELNTPVGNALTVVTTCAEKNKHFIHKLLAGNVRKSELESYVRDMSEAESLASRNLRKAADLIHGFKQVAIDQTSYQRRQFNLLETVQELLLTIQPMLRQTEIVIQVDIAESIRLDSFPGPLGQIITNLVANAVTHAFDETIHKPEIIIAAHLLESSDCLTLSVSDNGVGIAPQHVGKVFDPFFTTRLGLGGSGLGLHIVHHLVTGILGGRVEVVSYERRGTVFTLKLPLVAPVLIAEGDTNVS